MAETRLNMHRIVKILNGDVEPQTTAEEVLLRVYTEALSGMLLATILDSDLEALTLLNTEELWHMIIAYAAGQKNLEENEQEFFSDLANKADKKILH